MTKAYKTKPYMYEDNSTVYEHHRNSLSTFWPSEQYAIKKAAFDGASVLDVGCNRAGLLTALNEVHKGIKYIGVDPDKNVLRFAKQIHPRGRFVNDTFPTNMLKKETFDVVFCFALFSHFPNWKSFLEELVKMSHDRIAIDIELTGGPTINDPDVSYTFYLGSGERVPKVIINTLQFVNFCFTEKVNASDVEIIATRPKKDVSMSGVPLKNMLRGVAIITKDKSNKLIFGAQSSRENPSFIKSVNLDNYRTPKAVITIDGKKSLIYPR